jgi:hypothetical protein
MSLVKTKTNGIASASTGGPTLIRGTEITVELVDISPALAAEMLLSNFENNRPIGDIAVEKWKREMQSNRWIISPQGIMFDTSGRLIDGQHRLKAITLCGQDVPVIVFRNVAPEAIEVLDKGKFRSYHTVLQIAGRKDDATIHSAVRLIANLVNGFHRSYTPNNLDLLKNVIDEHGVVLRNLRSACASGRSSAPYAKGSNFLFASFLGATVNPEATYTFIEKFKTGLEIKKDEPVGVLRDYISRRQLLPEEVFTRTAYCLAKTIRNETITMLQTSNIQGFVKDLILASKLPQDGTFHSSFLRDKR